MADFFSRLIARSQPNAPGLRPQKAARFAPSQTVYAPPPSLTVSPSSTVMADTVMADTVMTDSVVIDDTIANDTIANDAVVSDAVINKPTDKSITESTLVESSRQSTLTSTFVVSNGSNTESNLESNTENIVENSTENALRQTAHIPQTLIATDTADEALSPIQPISNQQDNTAIAPPSPPINPSHPIREQSTPLPSPPALHPSEPITTPHRLEVSTSQPLNAEQEPALPRSSQRPQETIPIAQSLISNPTVLESTISELSAPEPTSHVLLNTPLIQPTSTQLSPPLSSQTRQSQTRDLTGVDVFKPTESNLPPSSRLRYNETQSNSALDPQNSYLSANESQRANLQRANLQRANLQKIEQAQPNPTLIQPPSPSAEPFQEQPLLPIQANVVQPSANEAIVSLPANAQPISSPTADRRDRATAPTIDITIGRIDIRASPPPSAPKARPQARQKKANLSLSAYLNKREQR